MANVAAHFEGKRIILDDAVSLPIGVPLRLDVSTLESEVRSQEQRTDAIARFAGIGRNLPRVEQQYIDDQDTYYGDRR